MTIHVHELRGCSPTPLAHYLKALAVLRLVSEQRDSGARGWWKNEAFWLATTLTREELLRFFLEEYEPTPILSPWNGGSGFYYEDDPGLTPLERSTAKRFARFRAGISACRSQSAPLAAAIVALKAADDAVKARAKKDVAAAAAFKLAKDEKDRLKDALLATCRRTWSGGLIDWLDAAVALDGIGEASWPALLGSGGNDGRLDFTNNSMQHLATLFDCEDAAGRPRASAPSLLASALFGDPSPGLVSKAVGQFFPGSAGGDNMGAGFGGDSQVNPWDFVLMLEGAVVLVSSVVRTSDAAQLAQAAAPFAVRSSGSGYGSAAAADEGPRGEQWMPLWDHPAVFAEVRRLFAEGRAKTGRVTATRAVDVARAVARLGAARGVAAFQRYGYIERNGQSNLAVPIGRWRVTEQPHERLLDEIDPWLARFRALARDDRAPKATASAGRIVDEAVLAVCRSGSEPARWQALLVALGRAEAAILASPASAADPKRGLAPLSALSPGWLEAANDGSPELRLAAALASQDVALSSRSATVYANVRAHWLPVDRERCPRQALGSRAAVRFATDGAGLSNDPDVVCLGQDLERDAVALLRRRLHMAPGLRATGLGIGARASTAAGLADVMAFLAGTVDDARIAALARPLMAVAWWSVTDDVPSAPRTEGVDAAYAIARLTHLSQPLDRGEPVVIRVDAEPLARLVAGDLAGAIALCLRRLRASGLSPVVSRVAGDARYARRLAASLAFPLRPADIRWCADLVTRPHELKETIHAD